MNKTSGLRYGNYYIYGYFDNDFYDSGKDGCAELNEFLDKFQTPPPPSFQKTMLQFFIMDMVEYMQGGTRAR